MHCKWTRDFATSFTWKEVVGGQWLLHFLSLLFLLARFMCMNLSRVCMWCSLDFSSRAHWGSFVVCLDHGSLRQNSFNIQFHVDRPSRRLSCVSLASRLFANIPARGDVSRLRLITRNQRVIILALCAHKQLLQCQSNIWISLCGLCFFVAGKEQTCHVSRPRTDTVQLVLRPLRTWRAQKALLQLHPDYRCAHQEHHLEHQTRVVRKLHGGLVQRSPNVGVCLLPAWFQDRGVRGW